MTDLETQEQAERMYPSPNHPTGYAFKTSEVVEMERKSFTQGAKWMQEQDGCKHRLLSAKNDVIHRH